MRKYIIFILIILLNFLVNNIYGQELGVKVTTDKNTYSPGEDIKIYITATNLTSDIFEIPIYMCIPPPWFVMPPGGFPEDFVQPGPEPVLTDYEIDDRYILRIWAKYSGSFPIEANSSYTWNYTYSTKSLSLGIHTITGYLFGYGSDITNFMVQSSIGPAWTGFTTISVPYISDTTTITVLSPSISATIDIEPDTLKQTGSGKWITCYIELP